MGFLARDPFQQFVPVDFAHRERDGRRGEPTLVESDPRDARGVRFDKARPGALKTTVGGGGGRRAGLGL